MDITVLPDIFIDVIVRDYKLNKKEGNIWTKNYIKLGGNATNFSIALAKLGIEHNLIVFTGKIGEILIKEYIEKNKLPINLFVTKTEDSVTVALESEDKNIMLTDPKGIQIGSNEIKIYENILKHSDYIVFGNWNNNEKSNDLLEYILRETNAKVYLDVGDLTVAKNRVKDLVRIINEYGVWVLSLNENELNFLSKFFEINGSITDKAKELFKKLNLEHLDIHTSDFTYTLPDDIIINVKKERPKVITGAGDTWNAANFYGYIKNFNPKDRLSFANEIAKKYILGYF